ncbi:3' exoribonuclease family, domain 1-domain-containing protein [Emericellopsis atlantica]|uniref:3' exoribonuclease family, domain 1-domain-containing protein n=1 Tax=Emericellopsis atlantica TaxID=2614577 RepID=A0A9P7ZGP0_9HYPO|nr:3' exoribonuclease family, domain 1-domain-containing protein [Emericellopsis atlantica]KAG9251813.1 3' exoribonuclease family, domain 1-domain-containing protein [Emericellopsis atlantica]
MGPRLKDRDGEPSFTSVESFLPTSPISQKRSVDIVMADRRRINGPSAPTLPPRFHEDSSVTSKRTSADLQTGVTPSASGSAYLECEARDPSLGSGMKITCTVHGPRSLPRSAPFSPHMVLSTHVKYAPFATKHRRGYLRDSSERDLSTHLETALRGALIADRWPKSGVDVIVTIIEGEEARQTALDSGSEEWDAMNVFSACVTVAAAALADAGIDCVDTVAGGVAALIPGAQKGQHEIVLDPSPLEHDEILAACCVAYLPARDEITNLWLKGDVPSLDPDLYRDLVARAVHASKGNSRAISSTLTRAIASN